MSQSIYDRIAEELNKQYPEANAQTHHSGGGIMVVVATLPNGRVAVIGDSCDTWGADLYDSQQEFDEGNFSDVTIETTIANDDDAVGIATQILASKPQMSAGAKATFDRALDKLSSAFYEVQNAWPSEFGDSFTEGYPFQLSFDEMAAEVAAWVLKSKATK